VSTSVDEPSWFGDIPANTPYVMVSYQPIPPAVYERARVYVEPALVKLREEIDRVLPASDQDLAALPPDERVVAALGFELKGAMTWPTLTEFFTHTKFAIYGLGVFPVLRAELRDGALLRALIERVEARAHVRAPRATLAGTEYRMFDLSDDAKVVFAVMGNQLVAGILPTKNTDTYLAQLLGKNRPDTNLIDAGRLKELRSKYGYRGHFLGYLDFQSMTDLLIGKRGTQREEMGLSASALSSECQHEIAGLVALMPRMVMGYEELLPERSVGSVVLELAPPLAAALGSVVAPVKGLYSRPEGRPLASFGLGFDLQKAVSVAKETAHRIRKHPYRCDVLSSLNEGAESLLSASTAPLAMVGRLLGAQATLDDIIPRQDGGFELKGLVAIEHEAPSMLLGILQMGLDISDGDVKDDGVPVPMSLPAAHASPYLAEPLMALQGTTLVVSAGKGMAGQVSALLASPPEAQPPLLAVAIHSARFYELGETLPALRALLSSDDPTPPLLAPSPAAAKIDGFFFLSARVTPDGLVFRGWQILR
jgi:hypothetical protein